MQWGNVLYFLLWAGLIFVMMRFGCGSHIMGHGHHHSGADPNDHDDAIGRWALPDQAVDPVCGMTVQTLGAKSAVYRGQPYYFCSQDCRQKFEGAPANYAKPISASAQQQERHHGC